MSGTFPEIDFKTLSFPSDRLTIKALRLAEPQLFATDNPVDLDKTFAHSDFSSMLSWERVVARQAYKAALGQPDPDAEERGELVDMLTEHYRDYGLSSGPHQTEQLVREIEAQASGQAGRHGGKPR